jgi:hypothetical protein
LRWVVVLLACLAVPGAVARPALADACGLPDSGPLWIDFAGHDAPLPAKPGMVLAVASGTDTPAAMRAKGAATVFFDLNFNNRIGTTSKPADPATIADKAKREFDYAVSVTGCQTPIIAENELFGAQTPTPWSDTNAQYRANALSLLQHLAALGARPALTIANPPYTGGDAAEWWRQVAKVAILIRQVYFTSPNARGLYSMGPVRASRAMRQGMRGLVTRFSQIGIPADRIALELQFQAAPGLGARAGLQPSTSWFEIVKLEALAAKKVWSEFKIQGIWSWGWATYSAAGSDPDKPFAACVWLWASRGDQFCNAPKYVQPAFDTSLDEGQLVLPPKVRCVLPNKQVIDRDTVGRLTTLTGDPGYAASVLLEQAVLRAVAPVSAESVVSAERAVIDASFGGNRTAYLAALAQARVTLKDARGIITDRLARDDFAPRFHPQPPPARHVRDFLSTYAGQLVRLVKTTQPAPWLDGTSRGWVVSTLGPPEVFELTKQASIDTPDGSFEVTPLGPALPLAMLDPQQAQIAARRVLDRLAHAEVYGSWLRDEEKKQLAGAICLGDNMPTPGPTDLSAFAPFLSPA